MGFIDIEMPETLQYQSSFGSGFAVQVQSNATGHEQLTLRASQARHRFSLRKQFLSPEEAAEMKRFVMATQGSFAYWKVKDWSDYTSATNGIDAPAWTDQEIGTGDGATTQFQLLKTYATAGATPYDRLIELPKTGTVVVAEDGGTPASAYTVNDTTGVVTFTTAPGVGVTITAGFEFFVMVRFAEEAGTLMSAIARGHDVWDLQAFDLLEKVSDGEWSDRWWPGGATDWGDIDADIGLSFRNGMLNRINPTSAGLNVYLPAPGLTPGGPNLFYICNENATNSVTIRDDAGTLIATLPVSTNAQVGLYTDTSGDRVWKVIAP